MAENRFSVLGNDGLARIGTYTTPHGTFETPNFMSVGTKASVKGVDVERIREVGAQIILVNTYHLWLRPGTEIVSKMGEIHGFSAWDGPILSDSGGFQIYSLQGLRKVTSEGVEFQSHIDGAKCFLSPEICIEIQEKLGVDIAMVLDECPPGDWDHGKIAQSLARTVDWARRCFDTRKREGQSVFAITQGGIFEDLRKQAVERLLELSPDGFGIGGLSVGETKYATYDVLDFHVQQIPGEYIRYLMGVGTPRDIVEAVKNGVDLFDCVIPTRSGRFGRVFVGVNEEDGPWFNIKNARHQADSRPLDSECDCLACRHYSRAYLHHLFKAGEMLAPQMLSLHNLRHYFSLMAKIRQSIKSGVFMDLYSEIKEAWLRTADKCS